MEKEINLYFNAIHGGDLAMVQECSRKNTRLVHSADHRRSSPLVPATCYNHAEIAIVLLENGAAVDEQDASGNTALIGVCFNGDEALTKSLIASGANVNATNAMGARWLIFATTFNRENIVQLRLNYRADIHANDSRGNTAPDHARMHGLTSLTAILEKITR